jgi:hypothetical protein
MSTLPKVWKKAIEDLCYNLGEDDPKEVIMKALDGALDHMPNIYGGRVLVATAPTPNKRGLLWVPDKTKGEQRWQGKVGLVLAFGPSAFKYDPQFPSYPWEGPKPSVGDWVYYRTQDTSEFGVNGVSCRYVNDDMVYGSVDDIECIW